MNKPTKQQLNALRDECYKIACKHGFHDEKLSERHFLCLVISELMEAVEADRKGRHAEAQVETRGEGRAVVREVRQLAVFRWD